MSDPIERLRLREDSVGDVSDAPRLLQMLNFETTAKPWQLHELSAVFRHQLDSPVWFSSDLPGDRPDQAGTPVSLRQLLRDQRPPVAELKRLKDFAKANLIHAQSLLPNEIAQLLYFAAILVARTRCDQRITSLPDAELIEGVRAALGFDWLDVEIRDLLIDGLNRMLPEVELNARSI